MNDLISRQVANTRVAQNGKYKYTFGNDEFNLEAAYHDCKFVFDGITDDDSFQEADTGLILYYANEIIYALHKALKGNDTNVPSNNCIDLPRAKHWDGHTEDDAKTRLMSLEPEWKKGVWISTGNGWDGERFVCSVCGFPCVFTKRSPDDNGPNFCPNCGADMRGEQNEH